MTIYYNAMMGIVTLNMDLVNAPMERIDALVHYANMHNGTNPAVLRLPDLREECEECGCMSHRVDIHGVCCVCREEQRDEQYYSQQYDTPALDTFAHDYEMAC